MHFHLLVTLNPDRLLITAGLFFFSAVTQDESPRQLDQSDEDENNSSDYFADAETSSCESSNDDIGWSEISENKGSFSVCSI